MLLRIVCRLCGLLTLLSVASHLGAREPTVVLEFHSPLGFDDERSTEVERHMPLRTAQPLTMVIPAGNLDEAIYLARPSSVGSRGQTIVASPLPA